jgi:putative endonuclease
VPELWWESAAETGQAGSNARKISCIVDPRNAKPAQTTMTTWSVYLLRCSDGSLYTGIATDVSRRLAEHEEGDKGAKYLRGRGPLKLVYHREIGDRSLATKVEHRVKRFPKEYKEDIGRLPDRIDQLLQQISAPGD